MPLRFRQSIMPLNVGQPSNPIRTDEAIHIFMICERKEPKPNIPSRDEIAESIWEQHVQSITRGYMRDLRRNAVIDIR